MNHTQLELEPGLVLDARRALWLPAERTLVVADLHLGYAWAHRAAGHLVPLAPDDTLARLDAIVRDYAPAQLVVLGDVLHGFAPVEEALAMLRQLVAGLRTRVRLVEGNHDFALASALERLGLDTGVEAHVALGPHVLLHGHTPRGDEAAALLAAARERGGRVIFGHEHPAVRLSDGVASSARCPCFMLSEDALVLPCFTDWSAGGGGGRWLSAFAELANVQPAAAIVAGKLLAFATR